jgi:hypothetical protein
MINDLDETIRELLIGGLPKQNGKIEVSFDQPTREWSARLSGPTINLFLYDVRENPTLRQHQWEQAHANGHPGDNRARLKRSPFRVDCLYMLTTWGNDPADEHWLLTQAMLVLFRFPILPEDRLVGALRNPPFEIQTRLASHDRLTNPAEVWSALDNELRPSVSYVVTLALDPWEEVTGEMVRILTLRYGQAKDLPRRQQLLPDPKRVDKNIIGGVVRNKDKEQAGVPLAGIAVAIKGTGLFATTNKKGRFTLGTMPPGEYTLVAWPVEGKPIEKKITVPPKNKADSYDLEL